jgi:hypothetical protein
MMHLDLEDLKELDLHELDLEELHKTTKHKGFRRFLQTNHGPVPTIMRNINLDKFFDQPLTTYSERYNIKYAMSDYPQEMNSLYYYGKSETLCGFCGFPKSVV